MRSFAALFLPALILLRAGMFVVFGNLVPSSIAVGQEKILPAEERKFQWPKVPSIRSLSQHFNEPDGNIAPWMFVPAANIKQLSTSEHPGLMMIRVAGIGRDIKGILHDPIKIDDYRLPWEWLLMLPNPRTTSAPLWP